MRGSEMPSRLLATGGGDAAPERPAIARDGGCDSHLWPVPRSGSVQCWPQTSEDPAVQAYSAAAFHQAWLISVLIVNQATVQSPHYRLGAGCALHPGKITTLSGL